jgi:hypothetical protein
LFGGTEYDMQAWHHVLRETLGDDAYYDYVMGQF